MARRRSIPAPRRKTVGTLRHEEARMNADLHMDGLKNTGKGNLFVIFGEPDIDILPVGGEGDGGTRIQIRIKRRGRLPPYHR